MNGLVSNRSARRVVNAQGAQLQNHHEVLEALLNDEKVTRKRIDALEAFRREHEGMTFRQRLAWLLKGHRGQS